MIVRIVRPIVLVALVGGAIYAIANAPVSNITCSSQFGQCSRPIEEALAKNIGTKTINLSGGIASSLSTSLFVKDYSLEFFSPGKINVHVVEKRPVFGVKPHDAKLYQVDAEGVVLAEGTTDLPVLMTDNASFTLGDKLDAKTRFSGEIIEGLAQIYAFESAVLNGDILTVNFPGLVAIFPTQGDREYLAGAFTLIYSQLNKDSGEFRIDNSSIEIIDLRFKNPVLKKRAI